MIGQVVGSYRITSRISEGGMGAVYRAEHVLLGRMAALKVLLPELCSNKEIVNRFFNEAKATTAIHHPGIVEIFDFGYMPTGHAFLVMEFLEGMTLAQRIKMRGPIAEGEAAMILRGVCSALAAAHAKGIVHRDLKPDNIFCVPDPDSPLGERYKLLDFGIAKLTDVGMASSSTKTGAVMGTPTYMSPEQCKGTGAVDHRADLYSLGCIFYELVTGRPPFDSLGVGELIGAHLFMPPDPPSRHVPPGQALSAETEALILNLLEKQPERRVQTARDLAQALTLIAHNTGWVPTADLDRPSMQFATPARPTPASFTPVFQSSQNLTVRAPNPTPIPSVAQKPTTLSAAAGAAIAVPTGAPRKSRTGILVGAAAVIVIGAVAGVMLRKNAASSGDSLAEPAAVQPAAAATPAPTPAPTPTPVAPTPAPIATPEPAPPPAAVEPAAPPATATPPAPVPTPEPRTAGATQKSKSKPKKPPTQTKPTDKPAETKPAETKKPEEKLLLEQL